MNPSLHINMILSAFDLRPSWFYFWFSPQNVSYQYDVIHVYQLIIIFIPNQCGTLSTNPTNIIIEIIFSLGEHFFQTLNINDQSNTEYVPLQHH